jgi:hypothetical protein
VVSTGAQTPALFGFQSPGDYATFNSNHTPDGTGDTVDGGIERHHPNASECPFEESLSDRATDTGPTESPADVEAPHPQRLGDDRVDCNAAYRSQDAFRVRGKQGFTGSIETHRA